MSNSLYLSIAVISDLHCQKHEKGKLLRTKLHTNLLEMPESRHPVQALKSKIKKYDKKVDYFFVIGDVTNQADQDGFGFGVRLMREIKTLLTAKNLIYAIGNHDMDILKQNNERDTEYMLKHTNNYPFDCDPAIPNIISDNFWSKRFCIVEDQRSIILILNSSNNLTTLVEKPSIDDTLIEEINLEIKKIKNTEKFKIVLCHHHPIQHSDPNDVLTSLDLIDRGDKLMQILYENNFNLFIHGHKHNARLKYDNNIPVFCAGSFSSLENTEAFNVPNTAHFINIYKDDNTSEFKGIIETWSYNYTEGWKKSKDPDEFFPTFTGFGSNSANINEITQKLNLHFKVELDEYKEISFKEIYRIFPEINFFTPTQQKQFEDILFEKYYITIFQNNNSGEKNIRKQLI